MISGNYLNFTENKYKNILFWYIYIRILCYVNINNNTRLQTYFTYIATFSNYIPNFILTLQYY
jgi:hypothetical protein